MRSKKGYFFIIDAVIGLFVMVMGLMLIFTFIKVEASEEQTQYFAFDVMDYMSSTKISDVNDPYAGPLGTLHRNGNITNLENTILQQVGEFYYRNVSKNSPFTINLTRSFLSNITKDVVPYTHGVLVKIESQTVYNRSGIIGHLDSAYSEEVTIEDSVLAIPSKRLVYGVYNGSELFGPYIVEVTIWK